MHPALLCKVAARNCHNPFDLGLAPRVCAQYHAARSPRRGAGVVERGGLENRCGCKPTQGSNPCLSASFIKFGLWRLQQTPKIQKRRAPRGPPFSRNFNDLH